VRTSTYSSTSTTTTTTNEGTFFEKEENFRVNLGFCENEFAQRIQQQQQTIESPLTECFGKQTRNNFESELKIL
jgi:hypothetical protein